VGASLQVKYYYF